ncbi:vitamin K epoxide reductase family protein [Chitinophaga rhizosphaerae]|uniref:vitamin K epoxide reductase family protein n=1 Tax=Chitinophaga rhizosphaerae TaxID=1864947 RepID=UPI000F813F07|nr:vitamin K epoxide reductase family protein [Chitinophaga rhizosphaerae]
MISKLLSQNEKCVEVLQEFLSLLQVNVTLTTLKDNLYNHPDFPSLLSISDILTQYGVANLSFERKEGDVENIPMPFIVQIMDNRRPDELFAIVKEIRREEVYLYHAGTKTWEWIPLAKFKGRWHSRIALVADATNASGEKNYLKNKWKEKRINLIRYLSFLFIPLALIVSCISTLIRSWPATLLPAIFAILTGIGFIVTILLLWMELDVHNPVLRQICTVGKKTNCEAVLQSKGADFLGTNWSILGFTYFSGQALVFLFNGLSVNPVMTWLAFFSLAAVPYVFFSLYYQWRIARQWCTLCLTVQAVLAAQLISMIPILGDIRFETATMMIQALMPIAASFLLTFLMVSVMMPKLKEAKSSKWNARELQKLKHNTQIFDALLSRQTKIQYSTDSLGITLGNREGKYKIVKVCNPYCGPCSKAHAPMETLVDNNPEVQVQIIFNASTDVEDERAWPVKHLLAIAEKSQSDTTIRQALDDWYLPESKHYENFATKYPMEEELAAQENKVKAMREWCNNMKIDATPTFFVNGYKLPDIYSVNDLKYFLAE